jgi:hypothetical protein
MQDFRVFDIAPTTEARNAKENHHCPYLLGKWIHMFFSG